MTRIAPKLALVAALSAVLWVVPSVGTQGMGTIGQRFTHPDRGLIDAAADRPRDAARTRAVLQRAARAVEAALGLDR